MLRNSMILDFSNPRPPLIIAEAGVNHNGSISNALKLVDAAAETGADYIKFQIFSAEKLCTKTVGKANYQKDFGKLNTSQFDMLKRLELSQSDFKIILDYCDQKNISFLASPFDFSSLDFLTEKLGQSTIKVASGEITNLPFLVDIGKKAENIILSTGMSDYKEIENAIKALYFGASNSEGMPSSYEEILSYNSLEKMVEFFQGRLVLLHCTSDYPCKVEDVNLLALRSMINYFNLPVGFSDHTVGLHMPVAAIAMGACLVEKHFTLNKDEFGPDHKSSISPEELAKLVNWAKDVYLGIGDGIKVPKAVESSTKRVARKSIVASKKIKVGDLITKECISIKRSKSGIEPKHYWRIIGKKASNNYCPDDPIEE